MKNTYRRVGDQLQFLKPKEGRGEGPQCRFSQSKHGHPHHCLAKTVAQTAAWKPVGWGTWIPAGLVHGLLVGPSRNRFPSARFSFNPYVADSTEKHCLPEAQAVGTDKGCCCLGWVAPKQKPSERQRQTSSSFVA